MSISLKEIIKDTKFSTLSKEVQDNLMTLLERINKIRAKYGKPMIVTSGLRTKEDQIRVYKERGITDIKKIPMGSQHIKGAAIDIFDPKKELQKWCLANEKTIEEVGLWIEDFSATPNWCHFQIYPPRSGKRYFKP